MKKKQNKKPHNYMNLAVRHETHQKIRHIAFFNNRTIVDIIETLVDQEYKKLNNGL